MYMYSHIEVQLFLKIVLPCFMLIFYSRRNNKIGFSSENVGLYGKE